MIRVNVDLEFPSSPGFKRLVRKLQLPAAHALGCCVQLWAACYVARTPFISRDDADAAADLDGFADALVGAGLADEAKQGDTTEIDVVVKRQPLQVATFTKVAESDGVRVRGVAERIGFLLLQGERSKLGVAARKNNPRVNPRVDPAVNPRVDPMGNPAGNPSDLDLDLDLKNTEHVPSGHVQQALLPSGASDADPEREPSGENDPSSGLDALKKKVDALPAAKRNGHQPAVDEFDRRYRAAYEGAKPTWGAKPIAQLKRLVAAHGVTEVVRRIGILFEHPPAFLQPPFDVGTLVQHFDKLAVAPAPRRAIGIPPAAPPQRFKVDDAPALPRWHRAEGKQS